LIEDLELTGNRYPFAASIFYLGFICGATPAILMAQRFPIERVAAGIVFIWGVVMMATAGCQTFHGLYAQRFFLGMIESGVSPMFMLVVAGFYQKHEQALRMGAWYCATGYVSVVSPLINYGLGHITGGSLNSWQYMYLVAGGITILWAFVILFFMPPDPIRVKGFTERQRYIAVARLRSNNAGVRNTHFKLNQALEVLIDPRAWIVFSMAFLIMIANGPVSTFIPIIISSFGFSSLNSLLLVMPAGAIIGTIEWLAPFFCYKFKNVRTILIVVCQCGTILAALLLWLLPRGALGGLLYATFTLASFGGSYAVLMGLQTANTAGYTKKSITASWVFLGYCLGNFVGPLLFHEADAPVYAPGFTAVVITSSIAAGLSIVYRYLSLWENKRRDKLGAESYEHAYDDDLTDIKVSRICR
jgi:MFS family permease